MAYRGFREASLRFANVCISNSEGKEGVRRKRVKSKAEEFHISVFPLYVHRYLDDSGEEPTPEPISLQEAEPEDIWEDDVQVTDARTAQAGGPDGLR
ncbi:Putative bacteriophage protein [Salmonella sp. NCTC 11881]|nr:Putative bacteriophage protein [Salmonella sp. NCTC 11881]